MDLPIYKGVPIKIYHKIWHIHKLGGKVHRDFCDDCGDVPTDVITDDGRVFDVINARGLSYGARSRSGYRKGYKRTKEKFAFHRDC